MQQRDDDPSYKVGYGKPPTHTRFKKGQSGNVKGRPKKRRSFLSALARELEQRIVVVENGKRKSMTKTDALAKGIVNGALQYNLPALKALMTTLKEVGALKMPPQAQRQMEKPPLTMYLPKRRGEDRSYRRNPDGSFSGLEGSNVIEVEVDD